MVKQFSDVFKEIIDSEDYKKFFDENPSYYLAHGFIQLNSRFETTKHWQVGFYSADKDNLALFQTNPVKFVGFEDAFKDGGMIDKLAFDETFVDMDKVNEVVGGLLATEYSAESPTSFIVVLQSVLGKELYNVTVVTASFSMLLIKVDALTGKIVSHKKESLLSLKKDDKETEPTGEEE